MTEEMKHLNPSDMPSAPPYTLSQYALAYQDARPALALMKSALHKPCLGPSERSLNFNWSHFALLRNLARVVSDSAEYEFRIGHPYKAAQLNLDGMEMAALTAHGGAPLNYLVSEAIDAIDRWGMEKNLPLLTADQLAVVVKRWGAIERQWPGLQDIVLEEGNVATSQNIQIVEGQRKEFLKHPSSFFSSYYIGRIFGRSIPWNEYIEYLFQDKNKIIRDNQEFYRRLAIEMQSSNRPPVITGRPHNLLMTKRGAPMCDFIWKDYLYNTAYHELLKTEAAIYLFKKRAGHYPQSLQALVPRYLSSVPEDPFNQGKPLIYHSGLGGKKFLLYSIGPDQVDNGGQPMKRPGWPDKGDMVAGYLRD